MIYGAIITIILILNVSLNRASYREIGDVLGDYKYTVGTVELVIKYRVGVEPGGPQVRYTYSVKGRKFHARQNVRGVPRDRVQAGQQYIVVYSKKNPNNSFMLFRFPVKEEGDFEKWLKEFKTNPPRLRTRRNHLPTNSAQIEK